jgi:hypothetical protein
MFHHLISWITQHPGRAAAWDLGIGAFFYICAMIWDAKTSFEDVDPLPILGLVLIPFWPFVLVWGGICWIGTKFQLGPFKD